MNKIDLRSDTVTKPTPEMLAAMVNVEVGDDVFGEDNTVNNFQNRIAAMFGMEAGLFVPSGVMSNQLGIKVLTQPGDEILIDSKGHIYNYETSGTALLSGVQIQTVKGKKGKLNADSLTHLVRGKYDWEPKTTVLSLENSTNKGGGACYNRQELQDLKSFADEAGLKVHMDGARIWNAITATDIEAPFFGKISDTISVCFSKGLGAPVGSMLLSSYENIARARRYRKMWGGGMRQIGLLAAAADFGVENNWPLLKEDHRRAKELAEVIEECSDLEIDMETVETNILLFDVIKEDAPSALEKLEEMGVRMTQFGPSTIRATFHYQISDSDSERIKFVVKKLFG